MSEKPWFEECFECGNDTFKVRVTPYGVCGSDTEWVCAKCETEQGGIFNDPLDEIPPEIIGGSGEKSDSLKKLNQITQEINAICDTVERENRDITNEETKQLTELSLGAKKQMKKLLENPLAV